MLLVHASPRTLEPYRHPNLGVFCSPRCTYGDDITGWRWAADNDAYSQWDADRYSRMLERIRGRAGCLFVTAPDVVGDWQGTLGRFWEWHDGILGQTGLPLAYVIQDGQPADLIPWDKIRALFVGGGSEWKMGVEAQELVREANRRGLWTHMGRVNSHQRVRYAKALGCDSVDGTSLSWFRDRWLQRFLDHAAAPPQLLLEATVWA